MGDWEEAPLGRKVEFLSGGTPAKSDPSYWDGEIPWVSAKDMKRFRLIDTDDHVTEEGARRGTRVIDAGTTLLLVRGMTLHKDLPICVVERAMAFNQDVKAVRPREGVRADYVPYLLLGNKQRLLDRVDSAGHGTGRLNADALETLVVAVPSEPEQRAIAAILGALDDKIELNRRTGETLEAMARVLYRSWFVDFDPVRAKAGGRDTGLTSDLSGMFPASLEPAKRGEIPDGWRQVTVRDIAALNDWTLRSTDDLAFLDYVEIREVMRGEVRSVTRYVRGEEPSRARRRLRHGDTVLSTVRPDRGAFFLCIYPPETLIASTGFAVVTPIDGAWAFVHSALTQPEVGERLGRLADGGAYPALRPEAIGGLSVAVPDAAGILEAFQSFAAPLYERAHLCRREARTLGRLRDALLPRLIAGDLRAASE